MSFNRPNLTYSVVHEENKLKRLLKIQHKIKGSGIIYVRNRRKTKEVADFLIQNQIKADYYHAGIDIRSRTKKQNKWKNSKDRVMVATNAFGMGIDKPDVRFVIHLDLPDNLESYFQEAGRAGRDENEAYSIILYENADIIINDVRTAGPIGTWTTSTGIIELNPGSRNKGSSFLFGTMARMRIWKNPRKA